MSMSDAQQKLIEVLPELKGRLRDQDYKEALDETQAGEEGIALDLICAQLHEYEIRIPRSTYLKLQAIGAGMGMSAKTWQILESLID